MHVNKTRALAQTALMAALSVVLLLLGTFISVNTLFFTALAAYLIGYSIQKHGMKYGGIQLVVCVLLDVFLNPDKLHWMLYLFLGGYIFLSELIFRKANRAEEGKKKLRRQLIYNWILFNIIYSPLVLFFQELFASGEIPGGTPVLWLAGQIGWFVYDKAYRVFFQVLRERGLLGWREENH